MDNSKSVAIKEGLRRGFEDGTSKMAQRRCYGYDNLPDGGLVVNPTEAVVVKWIFERYLAGDSLGKIAGCLARAGVVSPTGKERWNREAIHKLLSNEKYTGDVVLQKTVCAGNAKQKKNDGSESRYQIHGHHEAIISHDVFAAVQQEKQSRAKCSVSVVSPEMTI